MMWGLCLVQAGEGEDGRMKSAIGIGALLMDGLGDTIRVSLTEDPELEIIPCGCARHAPCRCSSMRRWLTPAVRSSMRRQQVGPCRELRSAEGVCAGAQEAGGLWGEGVPGGLRHRAL